MHDLYCSKLSLDLSRVLLWEYSQSNTCTEVCRPTPDLKAMSGGHVLGDWLGWWTDWFNLWSRERIELLKGILDFSTRHYFGGLNTGKAKINVLCGIMSNLFWSLFHIYFLLPSFPYYFLWCPRLHMCHFFVYFLLRMLVNCRRGVCHPEEVSYCL